MDAPPTTDRKARPSSFPIWLALLTNVLWWPVLLIWLGLAVMGTDSCPGTGGAIDAATPKICYGTVQFEVFELPGVMWVLGMLIILVGGCIAVIVKMRPGWIIALGCLVCPAGLVISFVIGTRPL